MSFRREFPGPGQGVYVKGGMYSRLHFFRIQSPRRLGLNVHVARVLRRIGKFHDFIDDREGCFDRLSHFSDTAPPATTWVHNRI